MHQDRIDPKRPTPDTPAPPPADPLLHPAGDARDRAETDQAAGGADSSPLETVPSGEKGEALQEKATGPGNDPPQRP
jgi:hypothetical protein